jgi:hypothetical protein
MKNTTTFKCFDSSLLMTAMKKGLKTILSVTEEEKL